MDYGNEDVQKHLRKALEIAQDEEASNPELAMAAVIADIRHLCDEAGIDYHRAEKQSYQTYLADKEEGDEDPEDDD